MQNFRKIIYIIYIYLYTKTLTIIPKFCMKLSYFSIALFQKHDNDTPAIT